MEGFGGRWEMVVDAVALRACASGEWDRLGAVPVVATNLR